MLLARMGRICLVPSSVLPATLKNKSHFVWYLPLGEKYFFHVKLNLESLALINLDVKMPDREEGGDLALWKTAGGSENGGMSSC